MEYKVSVIVPCYRVAPYIERCARSLFSQTLDSVQFIFVDDCSDDDTIPRLEALIESIPHVRERTLIVRHEQNRGVSAARETGMRYAEGEYIAYCDSDDWVESSMYETLYNAALRQDADMVECGFWQDNGHFWRRRHAMPVPDNGVLGLLSDIIRPYLWCRIVRADRYKGIHFPPVSFMEDLVIVAQLLHNCNRRVVVDEPLYYYYFNPISLTHITNSENCSRKIRDGMVIYGFLHDFVMQHYAVDEKDFIQTKINICIKFLPTWLATGDPVWRKAFLNTFPDITPAVLFDRRLSWNRKKIYLEVITGTYPLLVRLRDVCRTILAKLAGNCNFLTREVRCIK